MTLTQFGELKSNMKLCFNDMCPKHHEKSYDPAYKFNLIYNSLVHNTNALTRKADENQVVDVTTWGHSGYGESGSGLTGRLCNKKVPQGGQTVSFQFC